MTSDRVSACAAGLGAVTVRRCGLMLLALVLTGCANLSLPRTVTEEELARQRLVFLRENAQLQQSLATKLAERLVDKAAAGGTEVPTLDFLILSGGGQHGAFGAGLLAGWGDVDTGEYARPVFDVVTGVSTGALIAPFALMGADEGYDRVDQIYRQATKELAVLRGMLFFLPWKPSLYDTYQLEATLEKEIDQAMVRALARADEQNRALLVGATDLDLGMLTVWDLTQQVQTHEQPAERVRRLLMASSAIPAAFPPVIIGDRLYVDGGASQMLFLGANADLFGELVEELRASAPEVTAYRIRLWVVINSKLFVQPEPIPMRWTALARRSLETVTKASTLTHLRRIEYLTRLLPQQYPELAFEFRYVAIPQAVEIPETNQLFDQSVTHMLSELGKDMGKEPSVWRTEVPHVLP